MKFVRILNRWEGKELSQAEAAEILGVTERTFRRWHQRYDEEGPAGLLDRRLGKPSPRRVPEDWVHRVAQLYRDLYQEFSAKHFHEHLVAEYNFPFSYSWTKCFLHRHQLLPVAPSKGAHRKKRPRRPLPGMLLHQDGSSHQWIPAIDGRFDLIVTMDDATSEIYSAFLVEQEGTMSSFVALREVVAKHGLFCALYTDRGSHYFLTPDAGGAIDEAAPTQVGRALAQLGIEHIAAYSPEARGRSERMFGTLQDRLPKELRLAGIATLAAANRFIAEVYLPQHNARFAVCALQPGTAFVSADRSAPGTTSSACRTSALSPTTIPCATAGSPCSCRKARCAATSSKSGSASTATPTTPWPSSTGRAAWRVITPTAGCSIMRKLRPPKPLWRLTPCGQGQPPQRGLKSGQMMCHKDRTS
ncbi:MAG: ISNCY family transposase [Dongiaceae bacterium]